MQFTYKALKDDKTVTGKIQANTADEAVVLLKSGGYFPIEVKKEISAQSSFNAIFDRVNFVDIVSFTRQLSIMLNAGVTLIEAFDIFKKQTTKKSLYKMIDQMDRDIRGGKALSASLQAYPHYFSPLYISLVKAGEASGKLNEILLNLADNLEKQRELRGKLTGAMVYPSLIIVGMVIVMFIMITFVIPQLLTLYNDLNAELPWSTKLITAVSSFSAAYWPFILIAAGFIGFVLFSYFKSKQGKEMLDHVMLRIPVISNVIIQSMLVETTRALAILVGSGVSILDALEIVKMANSNVEFQQAFSTVAKKVEKGVSLGNAMKDERIFPPLIVQMAVVGEQTGHLDETMGKISDYFEIESEMAIKTMTTLIEPTVLVVLGVSIGFLIFSVITPIYSLTNSIT